MLRQLRLEFSISSKAGVLLQHADCRTFVCADSSSCCESLLDCVNATLCQTARISRIFARGFLRPCLTLKSSSLEISKSQHALNFAILLLKKVFLAVWIKSPSSVYILFCFEIALALRLSRSVSKPPNQPIRSLLDFLCANHFFDKALTTALLSTIVALHRVPVSLALSRAGAFAIWPRTSLSELRSSSNTLETGLKKMAKCGDREISTVS